MPNFRIIVATIAILLSSSLLSFSQTPLPYFTYGKGLGITTPDSTFSINTRIRIQNRFGFTTDSEDDFDVKEVEARIRRLRLRFDGFIYSPKLTYVVQLSFSRGDMDYEAMSFPNVIRDAYIQYAFTKRFSIGFGQTKLPGNRQRVNSSGDLQLTDRSMVSATFNVDRDFGAFVNYKREYVTFRGAISSGEGRNMSTSDHGLAYTGRVELLPFGAFKNGGDYFEGDLMREARPKVSFGLAYNFNDNAMRTGGQLGPLLYASRDIRTTMFDVLYKHKGWALAAELMTRDSADPITTDAVGTERYVYVGSGQNYQLSYLFKNNFEIVGRYSLLEPGKGIQAKEKEKEHFTLGLNKYIMGHRVKLQSEITLEQWQQLVSDVSGKFWMYRFQVEVGF